MASIGEKIVSVRRFVITQALARRFGPIAGTVISNMQRSLDPFDRWAARQRQQREITEALSKVKMDVKVRGLGDMRRAMRPRRQGG